MCGRRCIEYVELLSKASKTNLQLDRLPEDPLTLAFLVAIAMQVNATEKQKLLEAARRAGDPGPGKPAAFSASRS